MAFFSRPNLEDLQFKQLTGSTLTLDGQTRIATTSGLTLATGNTNTTGVIVTASGASSATNNYVLTYDDADKIIKLKESSASGGTGVYDCASPTTCSIGGLNENTPIYCCPVNWILEKMLVPNVPPIVVDPTISSFVLHDNFNSPSLSIYEQGTILNVSGVTNSNAGCINPLYCGCPPYTCVQRSCGVSGYSYNCLGSPSYNFYSCAIPSACQDFGVLTVVSTNNYYARAHFSGGTQPYYSDCTTCCGDALSPYITPQLCDGISGIYPWYWGIESSGGAASGVNRPTSDCVKSIITGGTYSCKCVGHSNNTLYVNFGSTSDDYIWFAVPNASATKTKWYETALNNGSIGGAVSAGGNLFPDFDAETGICSSSPVWNGQTYKIYISNYQTAASTIMELRNS